MKYIIEYNSKSNLDFNPNNKLFIYDFGHIKGFLYDNEFIMYKIIRKYDSKEIVELYEQNIPKISFSVEEYDCYYANNTYSTENFHISVKPFLKAESLPFEPSPQPLPSPQPQHQKKHDYKKRNSQVKNEQKSKNEGRSTAITQQVGHQTQFSLDYSTAVKPQWTSLDQLMKVPLPLVAREHQKQQMPPRQNSHLLMPKRSSSSQVRPHQELTGKRVQNSKHPN